MRRLTFPGFLASYVRALSGSDTLAFAKLVALLPAEPRLAEPLLLWTAVTGRAARMQSLLSKAGKHVDSRLVGELQLLDGLARSERLEAVLASGDSTLPPEYGKVWRSYVARRDAPQRDARLKLDARERILALESSKHISRYRMAKDLGLNPGNLHAFLTQGEPRCMALDRTYRLVEYLEAA